MKLFTILPFGAHVVVNQEDKNPVSCALHLDLQEQYKLFNATK